jgi:hypothetical protein
MGHADGLSRLRQLPMVAAVTMRDLLNPPGPGDDASEAPTEGREGAPETSTPADPGAAVEVGEHTDGEASPDPERDADEDAAEGVRRLSQEEQEEDDSGRPAAERSVLDAFGLDSEKFLEEQGRTPWMVAMKAFLECGALSVDTQLRVLVLRMSPNFVMKNGVLMRRVHLKARARPASTITVPTIPLPFIEAVLHACHSDNFSAHLGRTKTADKVRRHAYWPGWIGRRRVRPLLCHL